MSRVTINNISWITPAGTKIFDNLTACFNSEITALVGNNGLGKSTIARIICGELSPASGSVLLEGKVKYLPQNQDAFKNRPVYSVLGVEKKYLAYGNIIRGTGDENSYLDLDEDWLITVSIENALKQAGIEYIEPERNFDSLSGGEKIRVIIASLYIEDYDFIILDEPTNHLDFDGRRLIIDFVKNFGKGIILISHDRQLLDLAEKTIEISNLGLTTYGGNYGFYCAQKEIENEAAKNEIKSISADLKKNILEKRTTVAKQEKKIHTAGKKSVNLNMPTLELHKRKGAGENTLKKLNDIHDKRIDSSRDKLNEAKSRLRDDKKIIVDLEKAVAFKKKTLIRAENINYTYNGKSNLWKNNLSFAIQTGDRLVIKGRNGSGKSTLLKMIYLQLFPTTGLLYIGADKVGFLDQHVSVLNNDLTVLDNLKLACADEVPEHELRIRLGRFLFYKEEVFKTAGILSGGERLRAGLALMLAVNNSPELILLDEPTNNLDLSAINELVSALNDYKGGILTVSHDICFTEDIGVTEEIDLDEI